MAKILGIETSCDETAAAVLSFDSAQDHGKNSRIQILSNIVASSASLQAKYGGVIPEQAAREQLKSIIPVVNEALAEAGLQPTNYSQPPAIDSIAVTQGPGLIGSLLVGVETAKVLAKVWNKPLIPINHLIGHFYANWINQDQESRIKNQGKNNHDSLFMIQTPSFPCLGLLVSGGHTDLVLFKDHGKYEYLGGTRDDAAGECFDKCARVLGYPYPGGPKISELAKKGNPEAAKFPVPMTDSKDLDFSFSGLKTSFAGMVHSLEFMVHSKNSLSMNHKLITNNQIADLAASLEKTIVESIVNKVVLAIKLTKVEQLIVAGGVAANQKLRKVLEEETYKQNASIKIFIPPSNLCTDNAAMIAAAAFFEKPIKDSLSLQANPNLSLAF